MFVCPTFVWSLDLTHCQHATTANNWQPSSVYVCHLAGKTFWLRIRHVDRSDVCCFDRRLEFHSPINKSHLLVISRLEMHSLLVCVSALWFCQLCEAAIGAQLCKDCRVNVIYPSGGIGNHQLPENRQIVRIINKYMPIRRQELEYQNEIGMRHLQFSFIAKIKVGNAVRCSAALVAPSLAITSSKCFSNDSFKPLQIIFTGGRTIAVDNVVKADFCPELSILHLKRPSEINPIALCQYDVPLGTRVSMMMATSDLRYYGRRRTEIISNRACKTTFLEEDSVFITPSMLCAKNSMNPEMCATSPGDVLLIDHQLCGLNVYGFRCFQNALNGDLYISLGKLQPMIGDLIRKLNGLSEEFKSVTGKET